MILVDTGPLVALFDRQDEQHKRRRRTLEEIREPILTTTPVLTEAFHMLGPASIGSDRLREFVEVNGLSVWFFDRAWLARAFQPMDLYADHPMDLADASLVAAAEARARGKSSPSIATASKRIAYAAGIATPRWKWSPDTSFVAVRFGSTLRRSQMISQDLGSVAKIRALYEWRVVRPEQAARMTQSTRGGLRVRGIA